MTSRSRRDGLVGRLGERGALPHRPRPERGRRNPPGLAAIAGLTSLAETSGSVWLAGFSGDGEGLLVPLAAGSATFKKSLNLRDLALESSQPPPVQGLAQAIPRPDLGAGDAFRGWILDAAEGSLREIRASDRRSSPRRSRSAASHRGRSRRRRSLGGRGPRARQARCRQGRAAVATPGTPVALAVGAAGIWVATTQGDLVSSGGTGPSNVACESRADRSISLWARGRSGFWIRAAC